MQTSKSAALWVNANRRNAARIGLGDRADALHSVITIPQLIRSIGTDPNALELLAVRQHELSPEQRRAALEAACATAPKVKPKATPEARPPAPSRISRTLARVGLYGKSGTGARS